MTPECRRVGESMDTAFKIGDLVCAEVSQTDGQEPGMREGGARPPNWVPGTVTSDATAGAYRIAVDAAGPPGSSPTYDLAADQLRPRRTGETCD